MATTTATITLSSTDLLSDELALNTTATLTAAGNSTGVTATIGLSRVTISDTSETTLFDASAYTDDKAHKAYIKNTSDTAAQYFLVKIAGAEIGRLYAGDWMFVPYNASDGDAEVEVKGLLGPNKIEYAMFKTAWTLPAAES